MTALLLAAIALNWRLRWNTTVTSQFRVDTSGPPNYVASVSWFGDTKDPFNGKEPGPLMIDLYELDGIGGKKLVTSTQVADVACAWRPEIHTFYPHKDFEDKAGRFHKFFPINFLSAELNGGQHSFLLVWWFDPKTMRPRELLRVIYGDASKLDRGTVVENSPAHYVESEIPKGVKPRNGYLRRIWTFDQKRFDFHHGPWRR